MAYIYGKASVVLNSGKRLSGAGVVRFFAENKDYDALSEAWVLWRNSAGRPLRKHFQQMVTIQNVLARGHSKFSASDDQLLNRYC